MEIANKVENLIRNIIEENNYILEKVEYVKDGLIDEVKNFIKEGKTNFLRVIINKNGIIDVEDCVTVSGLINPILDEADLIEENYILDVCSNGGYYE